MDHAHKSVMSDITTARIDHARMRIEKLCDKLMTITHPRATGYADHSRARAHSHSMADRNRWEIEWIEKKKRAHARLAHPYLDQKELISETEICIFW